MRLKGRLKTWHDERGYGFIEPCVAGEDLFVHIRSIRGSEGRRPQVGELLTYEAGRDARGRPRAEQVRYSLDPVRAAPAPAPRRRRAGRRWAVPLALVALAAVVAGGAAGRLPLAVVAWTFGASAVAYLSYVWDKVAATDGRWRTPEKTLLLLGLAGGWPGALLAQERLRHKTAKASFQFAFWLTVLLNVAALGWLVATDFRVIETLR